MGKNGREIYMYCLGFVVIAGVFILVGLMVYHEVPAGSKDIINISIGILIGMAVSVVNFFFGSSKASSEKTDAMIADSANKTVLLANSTPVNTETK